MKFSLALITPTIFIKLIMMTHHIMKKISMITSTASNFTSGLSNRRNYNSILLKTTSAAKIPRSNQRKKKRFLNPKKCRGI